MIAGLLPTYGFLFKGSCLRAFIFYRTAVAAELRIRFRTNPVASF